MCHFYNWLGGVKLIGTNKLTLIRQLRVHGKGNVVELHSHLPKDVKIYIYGNNHRLIIEENVIFKEGVIWFEDNDCEIRIGKGTTIEEAHLAAAENGSRLTIGEDCMFSRGIRIVTTDSHSIIDLTTGNRTNFGKDVTIGNHVWLGYNVSVNKGCQIGDNSVVAGNSVVTKSLAKNTINAGIPAREVKTNVTWNRERITSQ